MSAAANNLAADTGRGPAEAVAGEAVGRFGFGFTRRFFLLWAVGIVGLAPALWHPRWAMVFPAWSGGLLALWVLDWLRLPAASTLVAWRRWPGPLALARPHTVQVGVENRGRSRVRVRVQAAIPAPLSGVEGFEGLETTLELAPGTSSEITFPVQPLRRGRQAAGDVYLSFSSGWGLADRWARVALGDEVLVVPANWQAQGAELALARSRIVALQRRMARLPGQGREFHHLREFRTGDEVRDISWRASARRGVMLTQVRRIERSQALWLVLDCGRLMRARVELPAAQPATALLRQQGLAKLDYAAAAALEVAEIALELGDQVGLLTYGARPRQVVPPDHGWAHLRRLLQGLATAAVEDAEADHHRAAGQLLSRQRRRGLVLWMTDLAETHLTPEVIEAATHVAERHLLLFVIVRQTDLGALARTRPESPEEMYRVAAARQLADARSLLLARMRRQGALTLEMEPHGLAVAVVNRYIEAKERGLVG